MASELPPTPGKVVALLGKVMARKPDGSLRLLAVGDRVGEGEVIVTAQNSFVELASAETPRSDEPAASNQVSSRIEPGSASLQPALRVEALSEQVGAGPLTDSGLTLALRLPPGQAQGDRLAPVADSLRLATAEDTALPISLSGRDADGTLARFLIERVPTGGVMSKPGNLPFSNGTELTPAEAQQLLFTPAPDFNGDPGSLVYRVIDTSGKTSGLATVAISVTALNDAPVPGSVALGVDGVAIPDPSPNHLPGSSNYRYAILEDTALSGRINATDVDLDPLRFSTQAAPQHGRVLVDTHGSFVYSPDSDFRGSDRFAVLVDDGNGGSATSTVYIDVGTPDSRAALPAGLAIESDLASYGAEVFAWHLAEPAAGAGTDAASHPMDSGRVTAALVLDLRDLLPADPGFDWEPAIAPAVAADTASPGPAAEARLDLAIDWGLRSSGVDLLRDTALMADA